MRLAVSGVSLAASRSRSAPTPLAKTLRRTRRKAVGWAVCCVAKIIKVLTNYAVSDTFGSKPLMMTLLCL